MHLEVTLSDLCHNVLGYLLPCAKFCDDIVIYLLSEMGI